MKCEPDARRTSLLLLRGWISHRNPYTLFFVSNEHFSFGMHLSLIRLVFEVWCRIFQPLLKHLPILKRLHVFDVGIFNTNASISGFSTLPVLCFLSSCSCWLVLFHDFFYYLLTCPLRTMTVTTPHNFLSIVAVSKGCLFFCHLS